MLKLSNEALGAIMMALQKSILEQSDIVPVLQEFDFRVIDDKLFVSNPPVVKLNDFALPDDDTDVVFDPFDTPLEEN
jgi:hypothetical protein